jgi:hypothetical protein
MLIPLIGLGLFAQAFIQVAGAPAAATTHSALGGRDDYHLNYLEEPHGERNLMLFDFVTFRLPTDGGAQCAANQPDGAASAAGESNLATAGRSLPILGGSFNTGNTKLGKGLMIYFDPTPAEVHRNAAVWFWDQEIFDYIRQHLHLVDRDKLSARTYVKAYERRQKGDWNRPCAYRGWRRGRE